MQYKLIGEFKDDQHPLNQILTNRGITDVKKWAAAKEQDINSPWRFPKRDVEKAIALIQDIVENKHKVCVIVDSDADGFTSAAIIINFLYDLHIQQQSEDWCKENITYILHTGKQHGLEDCYKAIPKDVDVVIIPDAGTNDIDFMQYLLDQKKVILCMDHHESDEWLHDPRAIIINNQICDYPNKDLSGAGVTWHICTAYDDMHNTEYAAKYVDLAALGNLSDMMSYKSLETRAIVKKGLENINNPFFYYMVEKNKFSINKMGGINYMSMAFYVTPFINAMVRSGTMEEKDLIFKSFLKMYAFDKIESGKRGHKGEMVPRVEEAVRICANVKARQTKLQDAAMALLEQRIQDQHLTENGIIILLCEPGEIEKNLAGLVANKIQAKYQHPCYILTKSKGKDDKEYYYRGSGRNYSMSENQDLRQLALDTGLPEYVQGHANAHGLGIAESKIQEFINATNKEYENISKEPVYWVDYVWGSKDINAKTILQIAEAKDYWGQEVPEPYVAVKIPLSNCNVQLLSPDKHPTIKVHHPSGIDIMKFKSSQDEYEMFTQSNMTLTAVCRCAKNEWNGRVTAQLIVEDFTLEQEWIF